MLRKFAWCWRWARPRFVESAPDMEHARLEAVRQVMRERVQQAPGDAATARLMGSIERAPDVRALWYLRSALMQALATRQGESGAREALAELDAVFREGWPDVPLSRLAALG